MIDDLVTDLSDPDPAVRRRAITALAQSRSPDALTPLARVYRHDPEPALRLRLEQENAPEDLLEDVWLAELSQLMPELRARYPDLPPPMTGDAGFVRARLFAAVAALGGALLGLGIAYGITAWLLIQVADILLETFKAPEWTMQFIVVVLAMGVPTHVPLSYRSTVTPL